MVVEIRDWCQNVGEYNTYNFCIWHFGLCVIVSKIDRCRSSDPPYEIAINPIFRSYRVSDVIIQSFLNRSRWNLVHTLVARRARSAISDCLVMGMQFTCRNWHNCHSLQFGTKKVSQGRSKSFIFKLIQGYISLHHWVKLCVNRWRESEVIALTRFCIAT